jgi:hypothetical protein
MENIFPDPARHSLSRPLQRRHEHMGMDSLIPAKSISIFVVCKEDRDARFGIDSAFQECLKYSYSFS